MSTIDTAAVTDFLSTVSIGVIVVAAGSGSRLGHAEPKAFVPIDGRTVLERSLDSVFGMSESAQIVVVAPADRVKDARSIAANAAGAASAYVSVVAGGDSRQASVAAGLAELAPGIGIVLVHDSARPFTPAELFDLVVAAVRRTGEGAIPGLPVVDTIKRTDAGLALETVDRSVLSAVQTPQGFPRAALAAAYDAATVDAVLIEYTDDAALFSAAGHRVHIVEGDARGFKITTPWDLRKAEQVVRERSLPEPAEGSDEEKPFDKLRERKSHVSQREDQPGEPEGQLRERRFAAGRSRIRTGIGIDVHAYDETVPLWLGGLYWPDEPGLAGHSDGDAVCHAVCDALLSAAGLGDIGGRFGTEDPRLAGAHGDVFVRETVRMVTGAGFAVGNVAVQVVGNRPRFSKRRIEVEARLTELVGAPVSVSATTSDSLGFTGRGEGLSAIATALIETVDERAAQSAHETDAGDGSAAPDAR